MKNHDNNNNNEQRSDEKKETVYIKQTISNILITHIL